MPTVQIKKAANFGKALRVLLSMGGMIWTRHFRTLVISRVQHAALVTAGVIDRGVKRKSARAKKAKTPTSYGKVDARHPW